MDLIIRYFLIFYNNYIIIFYKNQNKLGTLKSFLLLAWRGRVYFGNKKLYSGIVFLRDLRRVGIECEFAVSAVNYS